MATESAANILATRMADFKQKQSLSDTNKIIELPKVQGIIFRPTPSTWESLEKKLAKVINFDGVWRRARDLYDQGYGAELETFAEIATERANQYAPTHYFARGIGKKMGLWEARTLKTIHETWSVRRSAMEVMYKLKLSAKSTKAILATAWRLKGGITRILALATEQGQGIKNAVGLFFYLTAKPKPQAA